MVKMEKNPATAPFESWAVNQMRYMAGNADFSLNENGDYKNHNVQEDWATWQASRTLLGKIDYIEEDHAVNPVAWEHCFEGKVERILSYTKTAAGFPPRSDAVRVRALYARTVPPLSAPIKDGLTRMKEAGSSYKNLPHFMSLEINDLRDEIQNLQAEVHIYQQGCDLRDAWLAARQ